MRFEIGYPKRTGDIEQDFLNLYNHVCELSDRLRYAFGQQTSNTKAAEESTEGQEEAE